MYMFIRVSYPVVKHVSSIPFIAGGVVSGLVGAAFIRTKALQYIELLKN